jgi:hypothetical protein
VATEASFFLAGHDALLRCAVLPAFTPGATLPAAVQAWCREKGLFSHHQTSWKAVFYVATKTDSGTRE